MKKYLGILVALVLAVSLMLVTAVPASAGYMAANYNLAVIKAADRLVTLQNNDGGWPWEIHSPSSSTNAMGITAMGVHKAYRLDDKAAYKESLAKAYKYRQGNQPSYTWEANKWAEVWHFGTSDITFLVWLAEAAADDASLLEAINAQVSGTTAADIAALAKSMWDERVEKLGGGNEDLSVKGTATGYAQWERDRGIAYPAVIPWWIELAVKAALALDSYYPDGAINYSLQADEMVNVLFACVDDTAHIYFDSSDSENQEEYIVGITGAIEASAETGLHTTKANDLKSILLGLQEDDGSWAYYGGTADAASGAAQSTAYAIMALFAQGGETAETAAFKAADWLVDTQNEGWHPAGGDSEEVTEVDSECAWALYQAGIEISKQGVEVTTDVPTALAIEVSPSIIDFSTVAPGGISSTAEGARTLTIANVGTWAVTITVSILDDTNGFYTQCLYYDTDAPVEALHATNYTTNIDAEGSAQPVLQVCVPPTWEAIGTQTGKIIFWAEGAE